MRITKKQWAWIIGIALLLLLVNASKKETRQVESTLAECNAERQGEISDGHPCVTDCFQVDSPFRSCAASYGYTYLNNNYANDWVFYYDTDESCKEFFEERTSITYVAILNCAPGYDKYVESVCTPDCSCAASTCTGQTCSNTCGGNCPGQKDCTEGGDDGGDSSDDFDIEQIFNDYKWYIIGFFALMIVLTMLGGKKK